MTSKGYVLIQKNDGTYEWVRFNVVPASNVLYEESELKLDSSGSVSWTQQGTAGNNYQSISSNNDVYGYDDAYNNTDQYSNGSALTATVDSTNKKSDKATFEFTGTGFDLVSACGPNTGVEVITVKQGEKIWKVYIIDTYYNDSTYGTLYQVPIVSYDPANDKDAENKDNPYGTYTVETTAAYLSFAGALNQALLLQTAQGLPDGGTADAQLFGQPQLGQNFAPGIHALDDIVLQAFKHLIRQGSGLKVVHTSFSSLEFLI